MVISGQQMQAQIYQACISLYQCKIPPSGVFFGIISSWKLCMPRSPAKCCRKFTYQTGNLLAVQNATSKGHTSKTSPTVCVIHRYENIQPNLALRNTMPESYQTGSSCRKHTSTISMDIGPSKTYIDFIQCSNRHATPLGQDIETWLTTAVQCVLCRTNA